MSSKQLLPNCMSKLKNRNDIAKRDTARQIVIQTSRNVGKFRKTANGRSSIVVLCFTVWFAQILRITFVCAQIQCRFTALQYQSDSGFQRWTSNGDLGRSKPKIWGELFMSKSKFWGDPPPLGSGVKSQKLAVFCFNCVFFCGFCSYAFQRILRSIFFRPSADPVKNKGGFIPRNSSNGPDFLPAAPKSQNIHQ